MTEPQLTLAQRWAIDEDIADEAAAAGAPVREDPSEPRWIADDLADGYGPDAPRPQPTDLDAPASD